MALIACSECGREVSDKAAACPQCGAPIAAPVPPPAPVEHEQRPPRKPMGCGTLLAIVAVVFILMYACSPKRDPGHGVAPSTRAPARAVVSAGVQQAAIEQFKGMPGIRHAEWLDGDFIIAARENGSSWQSVADAACVWIRRQGAPSGFAVVVLEASALQNKRWEQLARARCN